MPKAPVRTRKPARVRKPAPAAKTKRSSRTRAPASGIELLPAEDLARARINVTTIGDLLLTAADRHPDSLALVFPDREITYRQLADGREVVTLTYKSQLLGADFAQLLRSNERRDFALQRSTTGSHRDDFVFLMDELPVKSHASQGQQKSFAIALKLAQFEMLASKQHHKPLLLLDDIFDRLDDKRIARLLELVADETFGQVFLTDTNLERTDQALARVSIPILRFRVQDGTVAPV